MTASSSFVKVNEVAEIHPLSSSRVANVEERDCWIQYSIPPTPVSTDADHAAVFDVPFVKAGSAVIVGVLGGKVSCVEETIAENALWSAKASRALTRK